jgi:hypothetical protein
MSKTFDQGKDEVSKRCQYFATNRQSFLAPGVKEAHIRQSLIDPFFEALGWDVCNASMTAPQYREVVPEDSLEIEGQQKAPDYTFRVGTLPKFYVEAKKCGVNISTDMAPAYQLRRYGFSAKLSLSILTDFEEFSVYDCASRPRPTDKASHGRIQYIEFCEYPDRWREIWEVFSREAVWSGGFDQYAASKRKKGTSEVDSEFLKDIEGWRDMLARNLALRNNDLTADDLNAAVQKIIDRIIFLRMAEDRKLEPDRQLLALCDRPDIYARFLSGVCRKADEKYNSGLFHFHNEKGVSDAPDTLTTGLTVDDKVLKPILQSLYFENGCPYHFGVLPVEILGTVYERFLGKVIRLTAGHQAKVEEKPEVRKAGGVYYTPAYIVNYIVQNTIGKQIKDKSPSDLAGGKTTPPFRVLDMACGSGSFLLGAYQYLLDHCLKWYQANPSSKNAKAVYQNAKGETCLTIAERKRILTTHIYGVDIDRQAVETTKLSLLLKALEGENDVTLSHQMTFFHDRALPNLSDNIKCGNSLIASDFSLEKDDLLRIRAFDWTTNFPVAMKTGGFDAIIGNPPYIRPHNILPEEKEYFWRHYDTFEKKGDIYCCFSQKAARLCKNGGRFSFIVSNGWLRLDSFQKLRKMFLEQTVIESIVDLPDKVFADAQVKTCIFVCTKNADEKVQKKQNISVWKQNEGFVPLNLVFMRNIPQCAFLKTYKQIFDISISPETETVKERIKTNGQPLGELFDVCFGLKTGDDETFLHHGQINTEDKPLLRGDDVGRYDSNFKNEYVWYVPDKMRQHRQTARPGEPWRFEQPKVLIKDTTSVFAGTYDEGTYYVKDVLIVVPFKEKQPPPLLLKAVLGMLNSRLLTFYYRTTFQTIHVQRNELASLPLAKIDFANLAEKGRHDKLVELVDKMLTLTPKLRGATSEAEKAVLQNAVTTIDREIDNLVYELYGLTSDEIAIVESEN